MTIKVLAESGKDKGRLLNQIVKRLLDELGYDDFRVRISGAGTDLEVKAKHRATQATILCKARALPREVGPDELKRFLAAYTQGKKKDRRLVGLFLAFSGLSRPAREWYAGMEEKGKGEFHVFPPEKLLALLRRARLIGPPEVVEPAIKSRIRTEAGPRFLAYHEGQVYWVQMTMTGRKVTGYAVLGSHGELVSRVVAREIKRLDPTLDGKRLVDIYLRDKIFLAMLDMIPRNLEALTKEVREPLGDVREVIQDLIRENLVSWNPAVSRTGKTIGTASAQTWRCSCLWHANTSKARASSAFSVPSSQPHCWPAMFRDTWKPAGASEPPTESEPASIDSCRSARARSTMPSSPRRIGTSFRRRRAVAAIPNGNVRACCR